MTVYYGRLRDELEAGCCLRQAQAAGSPAADSPAAGSLAELVEASEDTAPPTVLTLAARGPNRQVRLKHGSTSRPEHHIVLLEATEDLDFISSDNAGQHLKLLVLPINADGDGGAGAVEFHRNRG